MGESMPLAESSAAPPGLLVSYTDPEAEAEGGGEVREGVALCLSGGGYRAMLFHLGALWRLNELGLLPTLTRVSAVSGGSMAAAVLALAWPRLRGGPEGVSPDFEPAVAQPLRRLASRTIDLGAVAGGALLPGSVADKAAKAYRKYLVGDATLQSLPDHTRFVFNATSVQTGSLWRFSKPYMGDYQVGLQYSPELPLADAIAASAAFPPVLSPYRLELDDGAMVATEGATLHEEPYTTDILLTDGGVYDNLGLETAWKRCGTLLVSDGGGQFAPDPEPRTDWARHGARVLSLIDHQVRSLRKRQLIGALAAGDRSGAYWGVGTRIANYELADAQPVNPAVADALAHLPTRLARLDADVQERLINWGWAVCDAAVRKHYRPGEPGGLPYPNSPLT